MSARNELRDAARAAGEQFYYTGIPCLHGHDSVRYTSTGCCRVCKLQRHKIWRDSPEGKAHIRAYNKAHPEGKRARALKTSRLKAGLPEPTRPPPTSCECCGTPRADLKVSLNLDHDHGTGRFRGWLCSACNSAIGMLGDNVAGLQRAIAYLERVQA